MQHQYWVTKTSVLKKLGNKEDACIVSSDAELDAKLELFRSISDSCTNLQIVLDQYQERLCVLAQEENHLGKFLRETGKNADISGKHMISAGKAISYSGQQRLAIRGPLLRLYHEVETFRGRAVSDMRATVTAMEKARTEYRGALSWMKSTSAQLDPDTGKGLENFRKAQRQVKLSKARFDKLTLDVLQKIDLLAAARCNMFSHVLANYQSSFQHFSTKVAHTLGATAGTMEATPQYEFSVLKELSQALGEAENKQNVLTPQDKDQMLFFQDEYKDDAATKSDDNTKSKTENVNKTTSNEIPEQSTSANLIDTDCFNDSAFGGSDLSSDLAGLNLDGGEMPLNLRSFMPSHFLQDLAPSLLDGPSSSEPIGDKPTSPSQPKPLPSQSKVAPKKSDKAAWFKLFAELDPLSNPDNIPGSNSGLSHAA